MHAGTGQLQERPQRYSGRYLLHEETIWFIVKWAERVEDETVHGAVAVKPKRLNLIHPVHSFRHACAINMIASGKSVSDVKNHLGHENVESTMIYLKMDLSSKRAAQKKFIEYNQSTLKHDPKIDELIDWEHKKQTLAWLDSL